MRGQTHARRRPPPPALQPHKPVRCLCRSRHHPQRCRHVSTRLRASSPHTAQCGRTRARTLIVPFLVLSFSFCDTGAGGSGASAGADDSLCRRRALRLGSRPPSRASRRSCRSDLRSRSRLRSSRSLLRNSRSRLLRARRLRPHACTYDRGCSRAERAPSHICTLAVPSQHLVCRLRYPSAAVQEKPPPRTRPAPTVPPLPSPRPLLPLITTSHVPPSLTGAPAPGCGARARGCGAPAPGSCASAPAARRLPRGRPGAGCARRRAPVGGGRWRCGGAREARRPGGGGGGCDCGRDGARVSRRGGACWWTGQGGQGRLAKGMGASHPPSHATA